MGDIVDMTRKKYLEHERCPEMMKRVIEYSASPSTLNQTRYGLFRGILQLPDDHQDRVEEKAKRKRIRQETARLKEESEREGWSETWLEWKKAKDAGTYSAFDLGL